MKNYGHTINVWGRITKDISFVKLMGIDWKNAGIISEIFYQFIVLIRARLNEPFPSVLSVDSIALHSRAIAKAHPHLACC